MFSACRSLLFNKVATGSVRLQTFASKLRPQTIDNPFRLYTDYARKFSTEIEKHPLEEKLEKLKVSNPDLYDKFLKMQKESGAIDADLGKSKKWETIDPKVLDELLEREKKNHELSVYG